MAQDTAYQILKAIEVGSVSSRSFLLFLSLVEEIRYMALVIFRYPGRFSYGLGFLLHLPY